MNHTEIADCTDITLLVDASLLSNVPLWDQFLGSESECRLHLAQPGTRKKDKVVCSRVLDGLRVELELEKQEWSGTLANRESLELTDPDWRTLQVHDETGPTGETRPYWVSDTSDIALKHGDHALPFSFDVVEELDPQDYQAVRQILTDDEVLMDHAFCGYGDSYNRMKFTAINPAAAAVDHKKASCALRSIAEIVNNESRDPRQVGPFFESYATDPQDLDPQNAKRQLQQNCRLVLTQLKSPTP